MEFSELNRARHSVRHYDASRTLTKEEVTELVREAQEAPSWKNCQSARYYAVLEPAAKAAFAAACLPPFNAKNVDGAAVLFVTTFVRERSGYRLRSGEPNVAANELGDVWGAYDAGLANDHLLLAAKNRGLDSLVIGIRDAGAIRKTLAIPENETILAVIAVGYAAADVPLAKPPRKPTEEILFFRP